MAYLYENMKDKSPEGILKETMRGLAVMAYYLKKTYGLPIEMSKEFFKSRDMIENTQAYMGFRNDYPELYKDF